MAIRTRILCGSIGIGGIATTSLLLVRNRFVLATAAADDVLVAVPVDITASFLLLLLLLMMMMMMMMLMIVLLTIVLLIGACALSPVFLVLRPWSRRRWERTINQFGATKYLQQ